MNPQELADKANGQLEALYQPVLDKWRELKMTQQGLSTPLFPFATPAYFKASPRILFVGQETHGWWTDCPHKPEELTVAQLMNFYDGAATSLFRHYRSPYWRAVRKVSAAFPCTETEIPFLFTNIFPCDVSKKRAPLEIHETFCSWKLLPQELVILKPDYVVFFCGREYYGNLEKYLGARPSQFVNTVTPLVEYQLPEMSWKGFVTYHPAYLARSKRWGILDQMIADMGSHWSSLQRQAT